MGKITVVFGTGVASAQIISYNGSTGRYEAQTYWSTVTFTNNNTSRYIRVWTVSPASGYKDGSSSNWGQVYFNSGNQYIYLSATKKPDPVTQYTLNFTIGEGVSRVYYTYHTDGIVFNSSFAKGEERHWTFPEKDDNGNYRYVELWVEDADIEYGYERPVHNVGTYYWVSNQTKVISATKSATQTYTVTYDANGGSGAPSQQTVTGAGYINVPSTSPTRSGYTFIGWNKSSSATTAQTTAGSTYYVDSSFTFYAVWRKNITLYYNTNGGSGGPSSETHYADADGYYTFTISSSVPSKSGSTFNGWWLPTDESPRWGGSTLRLSSDATLTAAWIVSTYNVYGYPSTGVSSFTISYIAANGNSVTKTFSSGGESVPVKAGTSIQFISCTLSDSSYYDNPIAKFCTDIDYPDNTLVAQYNASSAFTSHAINFSQNIQVKASIIQVTLSFNANGGTGEPDPITQNINTSFRIPAKVPTRDGYLFNGWYTETDTGPYWSGDSITLTHDQTLIATWRIKTFNLYLIVGTGITSFDVSYVNASGTTMVVTVTANQTVEAKDGTVVEFVSAQPQPTYVSPYGYIYPDSEFPDYSNPLEAGSSFIITQSMNMEAKANKASITLFAYHEDGDVGYFQKGLPVHLALTAAAWNALKAKVKEVREIWQDPEAAYLDVQVGSGTEITAIEFNSMRQVIGNTTNHGALPRAVAQGDIITPDLFNGPSSLKSAINESIMEIISS